MQTTDNYQGYKQFKKKTIALASLIERQVEILRNLNKPKQEGKLALLKEVVESSSFKVMVLGEFKRGKSTFINALLGEDVLPAYSTPCTAIINEVKWGDEKKALLHFTQTGNNLKKEPINVPVSEIEEYVVIKDEDEDEGESKKKNENSYEKLELFWPLKLCDCNVEIIDSPGLNEHKTREQIATDYLPKVDAIILVLSCEQLFSRSERKIVDQTLIPIGHEDIFFICNRINMIRSKEIDRVKQSAFKVLKPPRTKEGKKRIFFVNALGGLEGKLKSDIAAVKESGILELEVELQNFLTKEGGRIKFLRPAQELKNSIRDVRNDIPAQREMLKTDVTKLEKRYAKAQEPLEILEAKRRNIVAKLEGLIQDSDRVVRYETKDFCRDLSPQTQKLATSYTLDTKIDLFLKDPRPSIKAAVEEISEYLEGQVEDQFLTWQKEKLEPLLEERTTAMKNFLDADASDFIKRVDNLRLEVSGLSLSNVELSQEDIGARKVSPLERIFSAAGGFLVGGVGAAAVGATFGYQEMLKSLIPQIIIGIISYVLLGLNPLTLVPMLVAAIIQGKIVKDGFGNKIKEEVGKKFSEQLSESTVDIVDRVSNGVSAEFRKLKSVVDEGLGAEIGNVRQQLNSVMAEKRKGQEEVDKKIQQLDSLELAVNEVDKDLDELIAQVTS